MKIRFPNDLIKQQLPPFLIPLMSELIVRACQVKIDAHVFVKIKAGIPIEDVNYSISKNCPRAQVSNLPNA